MNDLDVLYDKQKKHLDKLYEAMYDVLVAQKENNFYATAIFEN